MLKRQWLWIIALLLSSAAAEAQRGGRIDGTVVHRDGRGVGGVSVALVELGAATITDDGGAFRFGDVPAGSYSITYALGDDSVSETGVTVAAGATTTVEQVVDWDLSFADTITVYSASKRRERIVEAPAAISTLSAAEIELEAASGQVPKLLEFTAGAEPTQIGLYDFNFNVRGFNNAANRRVAVLIDGRDPSIPAVSNQEWAALGFLLDDLASVELIRGPSAALYGKNTFNGIINLVTKPPRSSPGGQIRLTAGELDTTNVDARWAGSLGADAYFKVLASSIESDSFTRSRDVTVEYPGLTLEAVPVPTTRVTLDSGVLRFDRYFRTDLLSVEAGVSDGTGETVMFPLGRGFASDFKRTWARVNYNQPRWNFLGYTNTRNGDDQIALSGGTAAYEDSSNYRLELQGNQDFAGSRVRLIGGVSYGEERVDTADPQGMQTVVARPVDSDQQAVFAQLDAQLDDRLKLVLAARWDDSSLHDSQTSPRASLVYGLSPEHTLRLNYSQAFQVGNYLELFVSLPVGANDLSFFDAFFPLPAGYSLGLGAVPTFALGNPDLLVEEIQTWELGYSGILGERALVSIDYFRNEMTDFISDLLPGVNPNLAPFMAPPGLPPELEAIVEGALTAAGLSSDPAGGPLFILSHGNAGRIESEGLELAFAYDLRNRWLFDFTYTWFDFEIKEQPAGAQIQPNTAETKWSAGVGYRKDRLRAALHYRWVDDFLWASGLFMGPVPSYEVVDLDASYEISDRWQVGINGSNVLDDGHYEAFGGDIIERRVLGYVTFSWN